MAFPFIWEYQEKHQPTHHWWQPCPSIYSPFTPVWPLHFNDPFPLSQSFPVCITGTHCTAPLKPNPQNGSGKENKVLGVLGGKVSQVYRGPWPTWNSGPNTDQTDWDLLWSLSLEGCFSAPWSPADCGALKVFNTMVLPLIVTPVSPQSCDWKARGWLRAFEPWLEGDSWCQCWISTSTYTVRSSG